MTVISDISPRQCGGDASVKYSAVHPAPIKENRDEAPYAVFRPIQSANQPWKIDPKSQDVESDGQRIFCEDFSQSRTPQEYAFKLCPWGYSRSGKSPWKAVGR
ncbi:uncharacterized protein Z518_11235 [Rhinocladiella mackenziei CBS 650.93]|uniref:Uncharacterized protein n=1 Tax=Rhinocladiella mackenziei CBS 650.93 TaxID=1442369 RepID=A0A0D2FBN7_9EURO|nr:uncharacterized protein Z518_11235 [Rhinocladiella mackenziei CBS 650.93]KIW99496.1 hypothetical protein Z518_11235 [Rhinocladiella mackenziei CBS 650.93]